MHQANTIRTVKDIVCPVTYYDWPFAHEQASEIKAHWSGLKCEKPAIYNGRILLMRDVQVDEGSSRLRLDAFETDFANFLAWRDFGFPDTSIRNCFSMAALHSADGAWLLGVMGEHTSNAGQIYFPAGTPDPGDIRNGMVDFAGSAVRELREETGLQAANLDVASDWSLILEGRRVGCMKIMKSHETATALCARIADFLEAQRQPELAGMHVVRTRADLTPARMPAFMLRWLEAMLP